MMKRLWILGICVVLALTGCKAKAVPQEKIIEEVKVEEEILEVVLIEDMDDETYKKVKYLVQEELMVFDASRFDEGLMEAVRSEVSSGMDKEIAKTIVEEKLSGYLDMWKREIISERLEFLVGEYSRADFDKLVTDTSNTSIKNMVVAYVMEKLAHEGYEFD